MRRNLVTICLDASVVLFALTAVILAVGSAQAQSGTGYVAMRWNDCYGDAGADSRSFSCDTNSGTETLVISAIPAEAIPQLIAAAVNITVLTTGDPTMELLPSWWQLDNSSSVGQCRVTTGPPFYAANFTPSAPASHCLDVWQGMASGGASYSYPSHLNYEFVSQAGIRLVCAIFQPVAIEAGAEVFIARVIITHGKTVGTGSCSGCLSGLCIGLNSVELDQPPQATANYRLFDALPGTSSDVVGWQMGGVSMPSFIDSSLTHYDKLFTGCLTATNAARPTWGAIKRMYR